MTRTLNQKKEVVIFWTHYEEVEPREFDAQEISSAKETG